MGISGSDRPSERNVRRRRCGLDHTEGGRGEEPEGRLLCQAGIAERLGGCATAPDGGRSRSLPLELTTDRLTAASYVAAQHDARGDAQPGTR